MAICPRIRVFRISCVLLLALAASAAWAGSKKQSFPVKAPAPIQRAGEFNGDVRNLKPESPIVKKIMPEPGEVEPTAEKLALQSMESPKSVFAPAPNMPSPSQNFAGLDFNSFGAGWPPDTVGDVGPNHFVQAVNTSIGIYNKTGTQLAAFTFNTLWSGAGTTCDGNNNGDPTVIYDPIGDRWIVADFGWADTVNGPYFECVAVSKTSDPVAGGWFLYAIRADDAAHPWLPDYPKMGIWPDGLYMGTNMFDVTPGPNFTYMGARVYAFNLSDLESGVAVRSRVVDLGTTRFSVFPSNFRGALPPAGRENLFVGESGTAFAWEVFKFHVDYTGGGTTFTGPTNVSQTSYSLSFIQVPTPQNSLDSLSDRVMMQVQYRNIGGTESLWVNHSVPVNLPPVTYHVQWAQINVTGGTINTTPVQQQIFGNLAADGLHRWMGSLAVDKDGNMAVGYSAANASNNPSIRYAGRLATDPANTLNQGEATLIAGGGSQQGSCGGTCTRWGDYSAMTVDPTDDCTFWYTTEYYTSNGLNWQTRIGAFKYTQCSGSCTPVSVTTNPQNQTKPAGSPVTFTAAASGTPPITVQWQKSTNGGGTFNDMPGEVATSLTFTTAAGDDQNRYRAVFTNGCGTATTTAAILTIGACVFCDDFQDGVLASPSAWAYTPNSSGWSEFGGNMVGTSVKKTQSVASPIFGGCQTCYFETSVRSSGGIGNTIWLFGWFVDKNNDMELLMKEESNKWLLKQRSGGKILKKAKALAAINPNQTYVVRITFDGAQFVVSIDGSPLITMTPAVSVPSGTVGFRVKATTGTFGYVEVN